METSTEQLEAGLEWLRGWPADEYDCIGPMAEAVLAEIERLRAERDEGWKAFYALRKSVAEQRYPGMTKEIRLMSEQAIEQEIQAKGLTAPRLTPDKIDAAIASEAYHVFDGSCLTVCCLTLQNGFTVTGESACASPANFNAELGRKIARDKAREKIWPLEGYLLRQRLADKGTADG